MGSPITVRALARGLAKSVVTTTIFLALVEAGLHGVYAVRQAMVAEFPLPYTLSDNYGPIPPWLDGLRILTADPQLIWRNVPNAHHRYVAVFSPVRAAADRIALLRQFSPRLPDDLRSNPRWDVRLNSQGDRAEESAREKRLGSIRIACLGDSWTFGMNADQNDTYPSRLAEWLRRANPNAAFEVMNFGVLGYSSFQGLQLLKRRVLAWEPDVVLVGFGMNDSSVPGYRDRDVADAGTSIGERAESVAKKFELYKLLDYAAQLSKYKPSTVGDALTVATKNLTEATDYDAIDAWTRVSPRDYEANIREMAGLTRARGARLVLLNNQLDRDVPYPRLIEKLAHELSVPLVDSLAIVEQGRAEIELALEAKLGLAHSSPAAAQSEESGVPVTVVFRVYRGEFTVPSRLSIAGTTAQLGSLAPNTIALHDDGTAGDEKAGDGVWSLAVTFSAGTRVAYVYTNSGRAGQWEGLDVPAIRSVRIPAPASDAPVYLPVDTFGRLYMQSDSWHTDATGYDRIAKAAAAIVAKP
jgi:lysophospholipase L1-like esterase